MNSDTTPSKKRRSPSSSSSSPIEKKLFTKRTALFPNSSNTLTALPLQRSLSEPISDQTLNSLAAASTELLKSLSLENSSKNCSTNETLLTMSNNNKVPCSSSALPPLPPPLRRTSSAPIPSDYQILPTPVANRSSPSVQESPNFKASNKPCSSSLPPLAPPLRRTSSAPIPSDYQILATPTANTLSPSPSSDNQESSASKRLKRMQEKMQEMTAWCYQIMHEEQQEEEEAIPSEDDCNKDEESDDVTEEAVWVDENNGGGVMIHFRCPCGGRFEILHSGSHFYYKLA